jgi:hypothetical protein
MRALERKMDDRIRRLCAQGVAASDADVEAVLQERLELVRQNIERLQGKPREFCSQSSAYRLSAAVRMRPG